jgi:hypothetical protein
MLRSKPAWTKLIKPYLKIKSTSKKKIGGWIYWCLPNKFEALGSILSTKTLKKIAGRG